MAANQATSTSSSLVDDPSNLIEYTYDYLCSAVKGRIKENPHLIKESLNLRGSKVRKLVDPFPKPSSTSRKSVESGAVTLEDNVILRVDEEQQEAVWEISEKLQLDEVESAILLRSYFYNEGYDMRASLADKSSGRRTELVEEVTQFYFQERISLLRIFPPLFCPQVDADEELQQLATEILSMAAPSISEFVREVIAHFISLTKRELPPQALSSAHSSSQWAKQILKEQLCYLEIIFSAVWDPPCTGEVVLDFYKMMYEVSFGSNQRNADFILDEESTQLLRDIESLIILIAVEILNVDILLDVPLDLELLMAPKHGYLASPGNVEKLHELIMSTPSDPRFAPIILTWAYVLKQITVAAQGDDVPQEYVHFLGVISPKDDDDLSAVHNQSALEPAWTTFAKAALSPQMQLFRVFGGLLSSPLLSAEIAVGVGSSIADPNQVPYRAVARTLLILLTELVRVEFIEEMDALVDVWVTLYGSGPSSVVLPLCHDFWAVQAVRESTDRRALIDVARDRFPVQFRPIIRILRAMTGTGADFVACSKADDLTLKCSRDVYDTFANLQTFTLVIRTDDPTALRSLYEVRADSSGVFAYSNMRPLKLPGGSTLLARSEGRILSHGGAGAPIVVMWDHKHSGWKIALEFLTEYLKKRRIATGGRESVNTLDVTFARSASSASSVKVHQLRLEDIGMELDGDEQEVVSDVLDLFRSVISTSYDLTTELVKSLSAAEDDQLGNFKPESQPPDLVEVILLILRDALSTSSASRGTTSTRLVTSALSVLTALLPVFPGRVWTFLRGSPLLFGDERQKGSTPTLLASERVVGSYAMTLTLLDLVRALFDEGLGNMYSHPATLQHLKTDVLLRALAFVHNDIWMDHMTWKYNKLSERFEIGHKIVSLYSEILTQAPLTLPADPEKAPERSVLTDLATFVMDLFLVRATASSINPIVHIIATGPQLLHALHQAKRYIDQQFLANLITVNLHLCRLILTRKRTSGVNRICLLEQSLFMGVSTGAFSVTSRRSRINPIETVALLIKERAYMDLPLAAIRLLTALCCSVAATQPSPPSIVAHLSNAGDLAVQFVRLVQQPSEELPFREAIWSLMSIAVETQPALANLLITGKVQTSHPQKDASSEKERGKEKEKAQAGGLAPSPGAVTAAVHVLYSMDTVWSDNPSLIAHALGFLDVVWQHSLEHAAVLNPVRADDRFWDALASVVKMETNDVPSIYEVEMVVEGDDAKPGEPVAYHAYRTLAKAHAVHIFALDMASSSHDDSESKAAKPACLPSLFAMLKDVGQAQLKEAITNTCDPQLHDEVRQALATDFPLFSLDSVRTQALPVERKFGIDYLFSQERVKFFLFGYAGTDAVLSHALLGRIRWLNLDWSLTDSQIALTRSWKRLMQEIVPWTKGQADLVSGVMTAAAAVAEEIAKESRSGDLVATVHSERLSLLLAMLNITWTSPPKAADFLSLLNSVHDIISSEKFHPLDSLRGATSSHFHRSILELVYYCARNARIIVRDSKRHSAEQALAIGRTISVALNFVIEALRMVFDSARDKQDEELDEDMRLLVAVFEQCTRPEVYPSQSTWLATCQESDLIRASLELFVRTDISGLSASSTARPRRQLLYSRHILHFHIALASLPAAAERLAHEGVMTAYCSNELTPHLEAGVVDATNTDLPGEWNPAHRSWCRLLSVTTALIGVLGDSGGHFVDTEIIGFIQLYGAQLTRVLLWNVGEPVTLPLLEEMNRVVGLFHAIASSSFVQHSAHPGAAAILQAFAERALKLLQQLNYALSHPNHLSALLEGITADERSQLEKENHSTVDSSSELADPVKRPLLSSIIQKVLALVSNILLTLAIIGKAGDILASAEGIKIPGLAAQVAPSAKVSLNEPASIGTLLELGGWAIDIARHLTAKTGPNALPKALLLPSLTLLPFEQKMTLNAAQQTVEATLVYATTQLSLWLSTPGFQSSAPSPSPGRAEEGMDWDQRAGRVDDRLKREVRDLATDLQVLMARAKEVFAKTSADDENGTTLVLFEVLIGFGHAKLLQRDR
ncbi:hypothetical protein BOTBODRAFT_158346 [Botryobasidium botryosum FD-172 SS1]|uniref:Nucleoporin NUP188 n=1 Tax=Botryobasidium botryosum (strain FD-172 SS1) TaxID=930990 RepID=A0A067MUD9_BOTB1|nr:hypothetical protein BOTBODRAFT_158346 [Botryobasidium botryosum FD-172 SS1]